MAQDVRLKQAIALHQANQFSEAENIYRDILQQAPDTLSVLPLLGLVCNQQGRPQAAESFLKKYLQHDPNHLDARRYLGHALQDQNKLTEAIEIYEKILSDKPDAWEVYCDMGSALKSQGNYEKALHYFDRLIQHDPQHHYAHNNRANCLSRMGNVEAAEKAYRQALQLSPNDYLCHANYGSFLLEHNQYEAALSPLKKSLQINPRYTPAYSNLGLALSHVGKFEAALSVYETGLKLENTYSLFMNRIYLLFLLERYTEAWAGYPRRFSDESHQSPHLEIQPTLSRSIGCQLWRGENLAEKKLYLYGEQGVGDEIMFSQVLRILRSDEFKQTKITVGCDVRLISLLQRSFPAIEFVNYLENDQAQHFDYEVAMGTATGQYFSAIQAASPAKKYLTVDADHNQQWQAHLAALGEGLKVGIAWRGGSGSVSHDRSTDIHAWLPLLKTPHCHFINLQYGDCSEAISQLADQGVTLHDWPEHDPLSNLEGALALIQNLDCVISIDNSTVHFAGALGIPCWTLLPFKPDWRWGLSGDKTFWYDSLRLWRCEYGQTCVDLLPKITAAFKQSVTKETAR